MMTRGQDVEGLRKAEPRCLCPGRVRTGCSGKGHLKGDTSHQGRSGDRRVTQQAQAGRGGQGGSNQEPARSSRQQARHVAAAENGHLTDGQWGGASSHPGSRGGNAAGSYSRHLLMPHLQGGCVLRVHLQRPPPTEPQSGQSPLPKTA